MSVVAVPDGAARSANNARGSAIAPGFNSMAPHSSQATHTGAHRGRRHAAKPVLCAARLRSTLHKLQLDQWWRHCTGAVQWLCRGLSRLASDQTPVQLRQIPPLAACTAPLVRCQHTCCVVVAGAPRWLGVVVVVPARASVMLLLADGLLVRRGWCVDMDPKIAAAMPAGVPGPGGGWWPFGWSLVITAQNPLLLTIGQPHDEPPCMCPRCAMT